MWRPILFRRSFRARTNHFALPRRKYASSNSRLQDLQKGLTVTKFTVDDAGVALLTLNRPDRLNAYNFEMSHELVSIFRHVPEDDAIKAVVVTGEGSAFCAGADLSDKRFAELEGTLDTYRDVAANVTMSIYSCRKPVIAAINGSATGIGITMTLPMTVRVVAEDAKIGFLFVRRGLSPEACSSWFLPRVVGVGKALEWIATGRVFRAKEEERSGLFNYVLPASEVLPKAMAIAHEIAQHCSSVATSLSQELVWNALSESLYDAHVAESKVFFWLAKGADFAEGTRSFLEKRPAQFPLSVSKDVPPFYPWAKTKLPGKR